MRTGLWSGSGRTRHVLYALRQVVSVQLPASAAAMSAKSSTRGENNKPNNLAEKVLRSRECKAGPVEFNMRTRDKKLHGTPKSIAWQEK